MEKVQEYEQAHLAIVKEHRRRRLLHERILSTQRSDDD